MAETNASGYRPARLNQVLWPRDRSMSSSLVHVALVKRGQLEQYVLKPELGNCRKEAGPTMVFLEMKPVIGIILTTSSRSAPITPKQ